ncbi:hypothetical protein PoB_000872800 [Plakobranchus ocellatus]|uniref:Uncharacterized protein n=1 Tax=Plakobranchus ocellatus TaxID=259542 RepID=A0AAV3YJ29_9GAST|nr:hypothetical protein PoB_000872800 [Plakobranchus ocellatus]
MEEEEKDQVDSDHELLEESLISRSTQEAEVRGAGLAEEPSTSNSGRMVEIESEEESSGDEDFDLVVDLERSAELDIENVLERDPRLQKIERFVCGCKLKLASGETSTQFTADWIFNRRLSISELSEEAKDYYIKGLIESPGVVDSQMSQQKKASRRTDRTSKNEENPVHNKVISGFEALRQAGAPVAGLEHATEGSLQISGGLTSHCATDAPRTQSSGSALSAMSAPDPKLEEEAFFVCI